MMKSLVNRIPEQYRFHVFLLVTSFVGVFLILVAVYNASSELELIHEIDNMHQFTSDLLEGDNDVVASYQLLLNLPEEEYRIIEISADEESTGSIDIAGSGQSIPISDLLDSRVNGRGGYLEVGEKIYTWVMLPLPGDDAQLLMMHLFSFSPGGSLVQVYTKRLLVPALFYIWLMVWLGYILRYLTHKLSVQKQAMEHLALHDTLTGLPNRNLLSDRLDNMMAIAKRDKTSFTIVMIDLDGFKKVNDTHGHAIGDALLKIVAERMRACLRPHDTVCRLGGDEFLLLLSETRDDTSLDICNRISEEISKPVSLQDKRLYVGSSIGVARYSNYSDSSDTLIHKADTAMYEIKARGGGILVYDESLFPAHDMSADDANIVENKTVCRYN